MPKLYHMDGLGNSFVIYDLRDNLVKLDDLDDYLAKKSLFADNYDQKIILLASEKADILMKIYNIDGSVSDACGNATRCVARIIAAEIKRDHINIEAGTRILQVKKISDVDFQVNMGKPLLNWQDIPLSKACDAQNLPLLSSLDCDVSSGFALNIGNPHIIFFVRNIDEISLKDDVAWLEKDNLFRDGVNVNIAQIIDKNNIKLKVWERGAGATLACGTGACASFYAAYKRGLVADFVNVILPGGGLQISINDNQEVLMLGGTNMQEVRDI